MAYKLIYPLNRSLIDLRVGGRRVILPFIAYIQNVVVWAQPTPNLWAHS